MRTRRPLRVEWAAVATWLLAALPVFYLALKNGGYDPIPRDQIGIAIWWLLLLAMAAGALPVPVRTRASVVVFGFLFGFLAWTALAFIWTESAERTATELARVATYLGILAIGISLVARRRVAARHVLGGVTSALCLVAAMGVLSRFHLAWFPPNELERVFPGIEIARRLSYPLNYSSAVGAMTGMTLPLALGATAWPRTIVMQALAAAALPIVGLALYMATSGTGVAVATIAIVAFFSLAPDRVPKLLTFLVGAGGTAILAASVAHHPAVARGLPSAAAETEGTNLIWLTLVVCLVAGLLQSGISTAARRQRPPWLQISKGQALAALAVVTAVAVPVALAAGLPGEVTQRWRIFKSTGGSTPSGGGSAPSTAIDFRGNGRYQLWVGAVDAYKTAPWTGIGPGTYEFWWARNGSLAEFVRNAHSLYLETLGELGIPGFLLMVGFIFSVLGIGTVRSLRGPPSERIVLASATAACAGFAMGAALDWLWQIAALPVAFMSLAAISTCGFPARKSNRRRSPRTVVTNAVARLLIVALSIASLVITWLPLRGETAIQQSQIDSARGELSDALTQARTAANDQPYAATPRLQEALILEQQHRLRAAAAASAKATEKESTNWRTWLILARIEGERGRVSASISAYRKARALNPKSEIW